MATTADMAKKYNKTADEIKQALVEIGSASAAVRVFKVTPEMERDLDAHFMAAAKPTAKPAARQSASSRHIGTVQITEKKKRTFHRPGKPSPSPSAASAVATSATPATSSPSVAGAIPSAAETAIPSSPPPLDDFMQRQVAAQQRLKSSETTAASALKTPPKIEESSPPPPAETIPSLPAEESPPPPSSVAENGRKAGRGKTIGLDKKVIKERDRRRRQQRVIHSARLPNQHGFKQPVGHVARELPLPETISVSKLAGVMSVKSGAIIRKLMDYGTKDPTPNLLLSQEEAWVLVEEFGHKPVAMAEEDDPETAMLAAANSTAPQKPRPPVVTVMGHVDHGKTSLLDAIRKTRVAAGEAGGITQHIGAYQVERPRGGITFLDTPGHSLFSQMRARGAQITDIVVLVVAADDGVKPQTEGGDCACACGASADCGGRLTKWTSPARMWSAPKPDWPRWARSPEEWGGDTMVVPLSAHTGDGIDALLDAIHTQSEVLELTAATDVPAQGTVVEASISKGRGVVATIIVRQGILRRNDYVVCSAESGRVRAMWDSAGAMLDEAPPSMPVEIQGLSGIPEVGEDLLAVADERRAREVADLRQERRRAKRLSSRVAVRPMPGLAAAEEAEEKRELNVIVKADMGGSREALTAALTATSGKKGAIKVIHSAVGAVSESDINLARAGDAVVVAFNVRPDAKSRKLAQSCGVKIMAGNVIYELCERAPKTRCWELLDAEREEQVIGAAEVKQVFAISKLGNIAGCRVSEGVISQRCPGAAGARRGDGV